MTRKCKCRSFHERTGRHVPDCPQHPDQKFFRSWNWVMVVVPIGLVLLAWLADGCGS